MRSFIEIFVGLLITVLSETAFFALFGFKSKKFIFSCVIINIITNLALNLTLLFTPVSTSPNYYWFLLGGELLVVLIETVFYLFIEKKKYELIPLTVSANCLSFLLGILFYYLLSILM